ncbi:hypothetical protein Hdeb2414_s0002g00053841 [Helianthus debilis subsp. tardiflorus]
MPLWSKRKPQLKRPQKKQEAEARAAAALKEIADANADRSKLNKTVGELQEELKTRESILGDVTSRATEAEARARQAEKDRVGWPPHLPGQ